MDLRDILKENITQNYSEENNKEITSRYISNYKDVFENISGNENEIIETISNYLNDLKKITEIKKTEILENFSNVKFSDITFEIYGDEEGCISFSSNTPFTRKAMKDEAIHEIYKRELEKEIDFKFQLDFNVFSFTFLNKEYKFLMKTHFNNTFQVLSSFKNVNRLNQELKQFMKSKKIILLEPKSKDSIKKYIDIQENMFSQKYRKTDISEDEKSELKEKLEKISKLRSTYLS